MSRWALPLRRDRRSPSPASSGLSGGIALTYTSSTTTADHGLQRHLPPRAVRPRRSRGTAPSARSCCPGRSAWPRPAASSPSTAADGPAAMAAPIIVGSPAPPPTVTLASLATTGATGSLTVGFAAPTPTGSTITTTTVRCASGDGGVPRTVTFPSTKAGPVTVTGATTGRAYRCWVARDQARHRSRDGSPLVTSRGRRACRPPPASARRWTPAHRRDRRPGERLADHPPRRPLHLLERRDDGHRLVGDAARSP